MIITQSPDGCLVGNFHDFVCGGEVVHLSKVEVIDVEQYFCKEPVVWRIMRSVDEATASIRPDRQWQEIMTFWMDVEVRITSCRKL